MANELSHFFMTESQQFKNLLFGLVKQAKADIERRFAEAKISITPFEYGIVSIIRHKPLTLAEVAKKLGIKPPSALPYVDELEKKKFITRQVDATDRRKNYLKVTKKGEKLLEHIMKDHPKDILNQSFRSLRKADQRKLISILNKLHEQIS